ncbi:MAG TPA: FAD-binding protein [Capsulimonadaceae bacterium]|jgi:succinate dehydrogenase / fumarate reductase flavoprotein subunit
MSTVTYETHEHDVIVIGAGGAGLRAAIEASNLGLSVGLICKSLLGKAHTVMAEGGVAAAMATVDQDDSWQTHFYDTMNGGKMMNNWRMAQLHAQQAPDRVKELQEWGALFDRTKSGDFLQRDFGGHQFRRLCHVGDRTGLEMIRTLQDKGVHMGIEVYMECAITRLLKDGDQIAGAFGYFRPDGRFVMYKAKAVILACGGLGRAYKVTSNSWECTGDGHALGYEAGAELVDMEFVQFHPTGMVWPPGVAGLLVTEAVRGEGGKLTNKDGERIMTKYDPDRMELSTRDVVARAIYTEVKEGRGTPHGGCFLDVSYKPAETVIRKLPSMYHQFKELANVDITKEAMEVGPTTHYAMGGVKVDADTGMTCVPGLFAAGECSGGMHGGNRLGGNSLSDLIVFGRLAGLGAAQYVKGIAKAPAINQTVVDDAIKEMTDPFERTTTETAYDVHAELQDSMQMNVGIFRTEDDLQLGLANIQKYKERASKVVAKGGRAFNPGWHLTRELKNMLAVSEAIASAAILRKESRGAHSRLDFKDPSEEQAQVNYVVKRGDDGNAIVTPVPKAAMPADLQKILGEQKDLQPQREENKKTRLAQTAKE